MFVWPKQAIINELRVQGPAVREFVQLRRTTIGKGALEAKREQGTGGGLGMESDETGNHVPRKGSEVVVSPIRPDLARGTETIHSRSIALMVEQGAVTHHVSAFLSTLLCGRENEAGWQAMHRRGWSTRPLARRFPWISASREGWDSSTWVFTGAES